MKVGRLTLDDIWAMTMGVGMAFASGIIPSELNEFTRILIIGALCAFSRYVGCKTGQSIFSKSVWRRT